jgi:protein-disulfide isomerase
VYVDYRPVASRNGYSRSSLSAFASVLDVAGPKTALHLHDLLFDHQPAAGAPAPGEDQLVALAAKAGARRAAVAGPIGSSAQQQWLGAADAAARKAGIRSLPTVLLDGKPLTGKSVVQLADRLENIIARKG